MGRRFDAVLFDAGGVLVLPDPTVLGPLLAPYGATTGYASLHRAHYAAMRVQDCEGEGFDDWDVYDAAYVRAAGVAEPEVDEAAMLLGRTRSPWLWRHPVEGAAEALAGLADAGICIGVVSNASGQVAQTLRRYALCQVGEGPCVPVACIVDSHIAGVAKPDPAIFDIAFEQLPRGIDREHTAYVGDSIRNDVGGAEAAGLHALHLDPYDDHPDANHERIQSLTELLAWT